MLKLSAKRLNIKSSINLCRTYLSQDFKGIIDNSYKGLSIGGSSSNINVNVVELLNNELLSIHRKGKELDKDFFTFKSAQYAKDVFEANSYIAIKYYVDTHNLKDLVHMLQDRLTYRIFLNDFSACYLLDALLRAQDYAAASDVAIEVSKQQTLENSLVRALCAKACFKYAELNAKDEAASSTANEDDVTIVKVRVKFVRNVVETKKNKCQVVGELLLQIAQQSEADISLNLQALAYLLTQQHAALAELLQSSSGPIYKDTLQTCLNLLPAEHELTATITKQLQENTNEKLLQQQLDAFIQSAVSSNETALIAQQKENIAKWLQIREERTKKLASLQANVERMQNIEEELENIEKKKQELWFFEQEDERELELFKRVKFYPKKWFGKKKKPRVIDDDYIPPEIRK